MADPERGAEERGGHRPRVIVVMGVSGSGKTTVGERLAARLGWAFFDGDAFHPEENVARMSRGIALTDADRRPWLDALADFIEERLASGRPAVVACSALKQTYRRRLRRGHSGVVFVYLQGSAALIEQRLKARTGHFMNPHLLQSQFDALEEPEDAIKVPIAAPVAGIVERILTAMEERA